MRHLVFEPATQIVIAGPRGDILFDNTEPCVGDEMRRMVTHDVRAEGDWSELLSTGWIACGGRRQGYAAVVTRARDDDDGLRERLSTMLDQIVHLDRIGRLARPDEFVPPSRGGSGSSGAPALIAAYTPPRRPN